MRVSDLVPWRRQVPSRALESQAGPMREEMNRLFEEFFKNFETVPFSEDYVGAFCPSVNVAEEEDAFEVTAELPGMGHEDIDVTLSRDGLVIKGEKKTETEQEEKNYFRRERSYGYFERTIALPTEAIDRNNVEAAFKNGVLTVRVPKSEEAKSVTRRIPVKSS